MKKLSHYLAEYYKIQPDILLCYRPNNKGEGSSWSDRCLYLEDGYNAKKAYNHRMTLDKEVVIEFDEESKKVNKKMALEVVKRLEADNVSFSVWDSGNKSYHVHCFFDPKQASNLRLLKSNIMRHYCKGLDFKPDLQLAGSHLIRAEYGVNEKTGNKKRRILQSNNYPSISLIPQDAWDAYVKEMNWMMKVSMTRSVSDLANSNMIKKLLDTTYFNDNLKDGRSRILFVLANILKSKYNKRDLVDLLQKWYKYTNGKKLTDGQIAYQVYKAFGTDKSPGIKYILQLLKEIES